MDLAQITQGTKPGRSMEALKALLEVEPANVDARLFLASLQVSQDQFNSALGTTHPITTVRTADQRDTLLYLRAFAALKLGDKLAARANAEQLKTSTASDMYRSRADDILRRVQAN